MGFTYNEYTGVWVAENVSDLNMTSANNFLQWGQPFDPYSDNFNHDVYNNHYTSKPTVIIDQKSVMLDGYGRGISLEDFPINSNLIGNTTALSNGSYSFKELQNLGIVNEKDRFFNTSLYSGMKDTGNTLSGDAAYVYGTVGFAMQGNTRFIVKDALPYA